MLSRPGRWLVLLRAALVVVGAIAVALTDFPPSYEPWAWAVVGFFAAVTVFSGVLSMVELGPVTRVRARILLREDHDRGLILALEVFDQRNRLLPTHVERRDRAWKQHGIADRQHRKLVGELQLVVARLGHGCRRRLLLVTHWFVSSRLEAGRLEPNRAKLIIHSSLTRP